MSLVTNCILSFSNLEEKERIKEVNSFFDCKPLISCNDESLLRGWYGGTKLLETPIYIGSFNYLCKYDFFNHITAVDWEYPEDVQLMLKEQDGKCFAVFQIPEPHAQSKFVVTQVHIDHARKHGHICSQDCNPLILAIREVYPDSLWFGQTLLIKKPDKFGKRCEFYYVSNQLAAYSRNWLKDAKPFEFEITGLYADRML